MLKLIVLVPLNCYQNYQKLGGLKQQKFILLVSGGQKSNIKVSTRPCSLCRLQGRMLPCLFQLLMAPGHPWLVLLLHHCSLCLHLHMVFFCSVSLYLLLFL